MGNEGKGKRRGREFTIHSNSVTRIGLTNERARGPCAEHRSLPREHCLARFHARKRCTLDPRTRAHTGLGTEVISPVSDFQSRQWSLLFDDLASRSCPGSVSKKRGVSNRVASPQRPYYTKAPSTFDPYLYSTRNEIPIRRLAFITDIRFPSGCVDTSRFLSRHLLVSNFIYILRIFQNGRSFRSLISPSLKMK